MRVLLLGQHVFHESTGGHEVVHRPAEEFPCTLAEILTTLPDGWAPELIVYRIPEYHAVPPDMADAPCASVVMVSDWNLHYESPKAVLGDFDHLFTERLGVETFRRAGFSAVSYFPLFAFRPHMHWRPEVMPEAEHDLSIVANLSPHVQRERARWIERIARLGDRYRVAALTGLFEEAYTRAVQRSRITFNRSIRGEMNMRAYEAPACGSLLFLERENQEIRDFLKDGEECVLYGDDDFEALVAHYLEHEDERARIAEAGWRAIQPHTYENRLREIVAACEAKGLVGAARRRSMQDVPQWRRAVLHARNLHTAGDPRARVLALRGLEAAVGENPWSGEALNDMAVLLAAAHLAGMSAAPLAEAEPEERREALDRADELLDEATRAGGGAVAWLNRAAVALAREDRVASHEHLQEAVRWADSDAPVAGLLLAPPYEPFRLAWERAGWEDLVGAEASHPEVSQSHDVTGGSVTAAADPVQQRRRRLLAGEAWRRLGVLYGESEPALAAYGRAADAFPQVEALYGLCRALVQRKEWSGALQAATAAAYACPLYLQVRWERVQLLGVVGDHEEQRREALALLWLARAMSSYQGDMAPLEDAVRQATLARCKAALGGGLARHAELMQALDEGLEALSPAGDRAEPQPAADPPLARMRGLLLAILGRDAEALRWLGDASPQDEPMQAAYRSLAAGRQRVRADLEGVAPLPVRPAPPGDPPRVAHFHASFEAGGIEQYILDLVQGSPPGTHDVFLYQSGGRLVEEAERAGARVQVFPVLLADGHADPAAFQALVDAVAAGGYDIAHLHFGGGDVVGHEAASRAGVPRKVETVHWTVSSIADDLDAVICPSQLLMALQAHPERAVHLPLGIDAERFCPGRPREGPPVIGRVSRLVPEKDPLTFARAAALVRQHVPEARFLLVGDGPLRAELEGLGSVTCTGSLRGDDLVHALQSMDVFAYTPLGESFGLVVAEAMACGLPVVCTAVDALPELVRDGFNGVHVPPRDPAALAEAILKLLADNRRRALMGKRSRFLVEQSFTRARMLEAHHDLYRRICAAPLRQGTVPADTHIRARIQRSPHFEESRTS